MRSSLESRNACAHCALVGDLSPRFKFQFEWLGTHRENPGTMNRLGKPYFFVLLLVPFSISFAQESGSSDDAFRLQINGIGLHFDKGKNTNQENWGLGIQRSLGIIESEESLFTGWRKFWELDVYKDSYSDAALSSAFGVQRSVARYLDFGFRAGLVYERGLKKSAGSPIFPALLPFIETSFDIPVNLRATVVPPISSLTDGLVSLQLIVDIR